MKLTSEELAGKVAVITGGGGILCAAMAKALAANGAKVAILDLNPETAEKVAAEIRREGGRAIGVAANVLDHDSLTTAHIKVKLELGLCDILINGAGGNHPKGTTSRNHLYPEDLLSQEATPTSNRSPSSMKNSLGVSDDRLKSIAFSKEIKTFFDLDPEGIKFVFDLNFIGTLLPTQIFAQDMVGKSGTTVINVSSMNAFRPLTKIPAYSGAKAAVSNFTQWLAVHFAKAGIRVNALAPGFFLTEQNRALLTTENGELTERGNIIIEHTPMERFGKPEDLLGTLLWLCGSGSGFVTGVVIPVDGGFSAFSGV